MPSPARHLWALDPQRTFLNHGSFGACPLAVLEHQRAWQRRLERDPVAFMTVDLERELDAARRVIAEFVGSEPQDVAFVTNTTAGVNAVLASLCLEPDDELLVTSHGYPACTNAVRRWCARAGATVVTAELPFPVSTDGEIVEAVLAAVTPRTRLALLDHVTSATALVLPVTSLVRELRALGVQSLIDGAHAPGMVPVNLGQLRPDYYVGNLHKWCCAPKGAAFLWAPPVRQPGLSPVVTSHGASSTREDRSRFLLEFDWVGTADPSAALSAPYALGYLEGLLPGGWPEIRACNHALVVRARQTLLEALELEAPCPASMLGSMATLELPPHAHAQVLPHSPFVEPLHSRLYDRGFQVMVVPWPKLPRRILRLSAHLYNEHQEFERLEQELLRALSDERRAERCGR